MNKRGSLSAREIIIVIISIVAFILAGYILYLLIDTDDLNERELCRLSILERATFPGVVEKAIPLSCTTEKICITTAKKNKCKQFAGESNVKPLVIKISPEMSLKEQDIAVRTIEEASANAMLDCWVMTGQGSLDIFSSYSPEQGIASRLVDASFEKLDISIDEIKPKCIVCSRIAFSDDIYVQDKLFADKQSDKKGILSRVDVNKFMATNLVEGTGKKYLEFLAGEEAADQYPEVSMTEILDTTSYVYGSSQVAAMFMQIKVDSTNPGAAGLKGGFSAFGVGALGAFLGPGKIVNYLIPGPGWVKAAVKLVSIGVVSTAIGLDTKYTQKKNQALAQAKCGQFQSRLPGDQLGCSLIKLMNWDAASVNDLCLGGIEGKL